jgi:rare lipoprotein A
MQNLFSKLFLFTCIIFSNLSLLFSQEGVVLNGQASYYHDKFDGRMTASGEVFDQDGMTCAHKTLDFGTILKVTNLENNLSVTVRVNDRGPFVEGRIVDLTKAAAQKIGLYEMGVCNAKVEIISGTDQIASQPTPQSNEPVGTTTVILPKEPSTKPVVVNEPVDFKSFTYRISVNKDSISGFTIQLGAFTKIENTFKLAEELHSKGFNETFLYKSVTNGNEYYRILYGDFLSGASAKLFQSQLLDAGYKGILVVP